MSSAVQSSCRCPACRYDLSASPRDKEGAVVCPECAGRWLVHELIEPKCPRQDKYSGVIPALIVVSLLVIIWVGWFVRGPSSWISLTFGLLLVSITLFLAASLWDLGIRISSHPSRCARVAVPKVLGRYLIWNTLPVLLWIMTFRFWAQCVAAI